MTIKSACNSIALLLLEIAALLTTSQNTSAQSGDRSFARAIRDELEGPAIVEYVDLDHTTLFATPVSPLPGDHINRMAVAGDDLFFTYPGIPRNHGNVLVSQPGKGWNVRPLQIGFSSFPSGMQFSEGALGVGVSGDDYHISTFRLINGRLEYAGRHENHGIGRNNRFSPKG